MATESGVGGKMVGAVYEYRVFNWQLESNPNLVEDTNASQVVEGQAGHTHRTKLKMDHKLTAEIYVGPPGEQSDIADLSSQPEDSEIVEGADVTLSLKVGTSGGGFSWYNNWTFKIDTVNLVGCDANGLARYTVTMFATETKPDLEENQF